MIKPVLRYPGAKWEIAPWIISHFPEHNIYVEPFFGSGAVFFSLEKLPETVILNDKSDDIVNLFRVMRDYPERLCELIELTPYSRAELEIAHEPTNTSIENARRFLVRCWQSRSSVITGKSSWRLRVSSRGVSYTDVWNMLPDRIAQAAPLLKDCQIENRDAIELIASFRHKEDVLIYADPPYIKSTRNVEYQHEMYSEEEHIKLLEVLYKHAGPVVLSGYDSSLYNELLAEWRRETIQTNTDSANERTEVLWINRAAKYEQIKLL